MQEVLMSRHDTNGECIMHDDAASVEDNCSTIENEFVCPECSEDVSEDGQSYCHELMYRFQWL